MRFFTRVTLHVLNGWNELTNWLAAAKLAHRHQLIEELESAVANRDGRIMALEEQVAKLESDLEIVKGVL